MPVATQTRLIRGALTFAARCPPTFGKVRTSRLSAPQAAGIRYERKVHRALAVLAKTLHSTVEVSPWFTFTDSVGSGTCSPDAILWYDGLVALVIEIKTTWVPTAHTKLSGLYLPVVNVALKPLVLRSLVICKNLTLDSPRPIESIGEGTLMTSHEAPVYQWTGQGPLRW